LKKKTTTINKGTQSVEIANKQLIIIGVLSSIYYQQYLDLVQYLEKYLQQLLINPGEKLK